MAAFVRFVFTIMAVGMALNLGIVLLANARSQRRREAQDQNDARDFKALIAEIGGRVRRADVVVEAQRLDARDLALESTLLARQYYISDTGAVEPLPVVRITIPGDKLEAHGLLLEFDRHFAGDEQWGGGSGEGEEYAMLRDTQLAFFGVFCGAGETAPAAPNAADERFTFLPRDAVPELVRLKARRPDGKTYLARQPSYYELRLWQYIWSELPEAPRDAALPRVATNSGQVKATWLKPEAITVRRGHTYSAFVAVDGSIALREDAPGISGLLDAMLKEGELLNQMPPE